MADWNDGYVSDVAYVSGYHAETAPVWLATTLTLLGVAPPDISRPFRYADLGCGNGVTPLVVAAAMPHAEVWGFDFNPAHVEAGRDVARRAGLTNVRFEEASFDGLASLAPADLPMFEYISAHGVLSWISLENRRRLFTVIGQRLAPGGIVSASYNVGTGWTGMRPVRTLMRLLVEASPDRTDLAAAGMFAMLEKIKGAGAAMFATHPALNARIEMFRTQDPRYVAHELLNRDWHPLMFPEVAAAMAGIKCDYVGGATLHDNIVGLTVPAGLQEMFGQSRETRSREMVRDLACGASFRRDMYQRGARRMSPMEHGRRMNAMRLTRTARPVPETIVLNTSLGQFTPDQTLYRAVLDILNDGPMTIGEVRGHASLSGWIPAAVPEALGMLLQAGFVAPLAPEPVATEAVAASARLNQVHAALFDDGYDRPFLVCPALGAAQGADPLDILALDEMRTQGTIDEAPLIEAIAARVARYGRGFQKEGKAIEDPAEMRAHVTTMVRDLLSRRLPAMRRFGVLGSGHPGPRLADRAVQAS